ncbi:MAG: T9SS type A sorting domain-containing protein [Flavobacteriales bacterium]|nr:T9SS type A sorting domain-containing protein [Flavobacteriales bacterium]
MYAVEVGPGTPRLARLLPDGTRDSTFAIGTGPGDSGNETFYVRDVAALSTGKILVAGRFSTFASETQYQQSIRLDKNLTVGVTDIEPAAAVQAIMDRKNDQIRLTTPENLHGRFQLMNAAGQVLSDGVVASSTTLISTASLSQGVYVLRVQGIDGAVRSKKLVR